MIANALGQSIEANAATGFADDKDIPAWAKGAWRNEETWHCEGKGANEFAPDDQDNKSRGCNGFAEDAGTKEQVK